MDILQKKEKREGLIGTIVFHALLLIAFIFLGLTYTFPPEEDGIVVNFGDSETGLGEQEPSSSNNPVEEEKVQVTPTSSEPAAASKAKEEVLTQEELATISVEAKRKKEQQERKAEEERKRAEEQRKIEEEIRKKEQEAQKKKEESDKLFSGAFNNNSNSNSQGINNGSGNQGNPNGTPGAENYGPGNGTGDIGFSLAGRKMVQKPVINDDSQEQGKVVVKIIVDKYGKVTKATAGEKGTTATSAYLKKISEEAALKTKFNANPDAAEEQVGTMTFTFKLR